MLSRETIKILKKHQIRLNKRKSQHYLVNSSILDRIIRKAEPSVNDTILDIGAGIGTLTIPLSEMARKVVAIEQDPHIADVLRERLKNEKITKLHAALYEYLDNRGEFEGIDFYTDKEELIYEDYKYDIPKKKK